MAQNAVCSVQTHSSPPPPSAREIATLTCIPKKNSQVGVSRSTRRNLPLSLKLSACVFKYHELLFPCYLWQCGRLVMHLKIEFQIEGEFFWGEREITLDLLRIMFNLCMYLKFNFSLLSTQTYFCKSHTQ